MSMINTKDILETIKMIEEEHLDIRTITMGISLRDLAADDINVLADKVYDKVTRRAEKLVATGEQIERELGTVQAIQNLCKDHDSSFKPYPIKLAYEASPRISIKALRALLKGLYEIILDSRSSKGDIWRFRDLCITYCGYKG